MFKRWAAHLTKGAKKYPDARPGVANWTLADGPEELARFKESAFTHFIQWYLGELDEDHAAGVFFNVNGAEYVKGRMDERRKIDSWVRVAADNQGVPQQTERERFDSLFAQRIREINDDFEKLKEVSQQTSGTKGSPERPSDRGPGWTTAGVQEVSPGFTPNRSRG
jgi:hypothetical protein